MFRFIHTYTPASFAGLVKSGLWRGGDGLKLMHKPAFTPPDDFNTALAKGAPLYELLKELHCPFYVDRLQGGVGYTTVYPYDPRVVAGLQTLLGERFWGFQMHEWASNLRSDMGRLATFFKEENADISDPAAWKALLGRIVTGERTVFLEAYAPEEWAGLRPFFDRTAFLAAAKALYERRTAETDGLLLPADSYYMDPRTELGCGARLLLPEAGWQIPNLRIQTAFARGMAKAAGVPWGIYYECWQNTKDAGFTIPFSLRAGQDEWLEDLITKGNGSSLPPGRREHGGSSLSLAERAWRFAYFSGAQTLAEEYGVCNTFRDLTGFELSPYGEMKRSFLQFTQRFANAGTPYTPVAAVLPKDLPMLDVNLCEDYLGYPVTDADVPAPAFMRKCRNDMERIFGAQGRHGNMGHVLKTGGLPAVCDIVYEDMPEALANYEILLDLTGKNDLAGKYGTVRTIEEADRLLDGLLPCRAGGGLTAAYNRTDSGWLVLLLNNDGVVHDDFLPDVFLPEADVRTPLHVKPGLRVTKADGTGELHTGKSELRLKAGQWLLLSLTGET